MSTQSQPVQEHVTVKRHRVGPLVFIRLLWGKLRRWYLINYRPEYVEKAHKLRRGACAHCGGCCQIVFVCPLLRKDHSTGVPGCTIYPWRPLNCSTFPIDQRDIRDRNLSSPDRQCGYRFLTEEEAAQEAGAASESRSVEV
jgi:hypothetical protein